MIKIKRVIRLIPLLFCLLLSMPVQATSIWEIPKNVYNDAKETWKFSQHYDLYIPVSTWHARFAYDKKHTDKYNEKPWGAGLGVSSWDEKGNWHALYAIAFKDSYNHLEPVAGYAWESVWRPFSDQRFRTGLGYTVGVTVRKNWMWIPVPAVLPIASIGYGPAVFQMTYVPGLYNSGNVWFAWLRFQF